MQSENSVKLLDSLVKRRNLFCQFSIHIHDILQNYFSFICKEKNHLFSTFVHVCLYILIHYFRSMAPTTYAILWWTTIWLRRWFWIWKHVKDYAILTDCYWETLEGGIIMFRGIDKEIINIIIKKKNTLNWHFVFILYHILNDGAVVVMMVW